MSKKYYVYAYIDPRNMKPFYIGKGCGRRIMVHLNETYNNTENKKKYSIIQGLKNKGFAPIISKISSNLIEQEAYELEEQLIMKYGRRDLDDGGILTNICIANRPPRFVHTNESRAKISKRMLGNEYGKGLPSPFKGKVRPELSGENNHFYGKKHSSETKKKMSEKAVNRPPRVGFFQTDEAKYKIKMNNRNRKSIHTPYGIYNSSEEFADETKLITANSLRTLLKENELIITKHRATRSPLLTMNDIGKTMKEIGYYFLESSA